MAPSNPKLKVAAPRGDQRAPRAPPEMLPIGLPRVEPWLMPEAGHGFPVEPPGMFNAKPIEFLSAA